jgi:hypothetical protein
MSQTKLTSTKRPAQLVRRVQRGLARLAIGLAIGLSALCARPSAARADLTQDETVRLSRGETVIREQTYESGDRRYIGGLTYTIVDATAFELASVLEDVGAYRWVLPRTKQARLVEESHGDKFVEVVQGNALVEAAYTLRVRRATAAPESARGAGATREIRFWLDLSRPHGIDDAWGFFRVEPFIGANGQPRVLLTYGVLVDMGPGIVRDLFEERVRGALLSVPQLVRRYVAEVRRTYD